MKVQTRVIFETEVADFEQARKEARERAEELKKNLPPGSNVVVFEVYEVGEKVANRILGGGTLY